MSEQINEFDHIVRERLGDQTATPPPAVWENIKSTRSFGHVVANKISNNWGMFGTLLMLLLAGGSAVYLFGGEELNQEELTQFTNSEIINQWNANAIVHEVESLSQPIPYSESDQLNPYADARVNQAYLGASMEELKEEQQISARKLPEIDLMASLHQAAFVKPMMKNQRLSAYIDGLQGWEEAKPKAFVRYYKMDAIEAKGVNKSKIDQQPFTVELEKYDYVMPSVDRKTFKERSSITLSITPQIVSKIMTPEYNLSSSYLELRDKTTKTRFAYTFGAFLHYELKKHKFIETGINFSQIYEEMHYEGEKRFSNQYDFVEIPVLMGYQDRNAKWGWEIKAGLGLQIFNSYKGYILKRLDEFGTEAEPEPEDAEPLYRRGSNSSFKAINNDHGLSNKQAKHEVVDLEEEGENPFKSNGVVNVHLSTGLVYYHSIKTSFVLTPSYRRSINSITKEEALFNERIRCVGVSFGARMKF